MDKKLARSRDALIQALGRQSSFWGLGRTAGEMYAVLYLSSEPVSLEELAQRLDVTKGNVSVAIRQLEQLGMVRRSWQKGDRRVFFEAEADLWKIAHSVLGLRHKPEFDQSFVLVEESARLAEQAEPSAERDRMLERLNSLQEFYRLLDGLVEVVLAVGPGRLKAVVEMFKLITPAGKGQEEVN
ncbi:MAG: MarR family transcriptional regulator [Peptococcaceae bacterium]|nr:MarR family transcriptional regulator [Peptococcaceae bacterium]